MRGAQTDEQVNMVGHTADGVRNGTCLTDSAAEERMEALAPSWLNVSAALLRAEHDVNIQAEVSGRHG